MLNSFGPDASEVVFTISPKSQSAKSRWYLWSALPIVFAINVATQGLQTSTFIGLGILAILFFAIDFFLLRKHTKPGTVVARLNDVAIEASNFNTKEKRFVWIEVEKVSIEVQQGYRMLHLWLKPSTLRRDAKSFVNGVNPSKPVLSLAPLLPEEQERLYDLARHHVAARTGRSVDDDTEANLLVEERRFQEKMVALAPHTWVTYAFAAVCIGAWAVLGVTGHAFINVSPETLFQWGGNSTSEVQQGQWWRLLTAMFLHGGMMHLLSNMVGLITVGMTVERIYGHKLFALIYLGSGLLGSAVSLHYSANKAVSIGASGAVFGVAGALLIAVMQHRKSMPKLFSKQMLSGLAYFIIYSLAFGFASTGIDNAAHIGGLLGGASLALLLPQRFDLEKFTRTVKLRAAVAFVAAGAAIVFVAATAPAPLFDMRDAMVAPDRFKGALNQLSIATAALEQDGKDVKAEKMTVIESDERSRSVHAPAFRKAIDLLSDVHFPPLDPRGKLVTGYTQMSRLLHEALAMESSVVDGKPVPVDPVRAKQIEQEILKINATVLRQVEEIKSAQAKQRK